MGNNKKRLIYNMAKKICDAYMTENNLVDKKISQKFKELRDAIVEQSNSIK